MLVGITGITGFIGGHLAARLLADGLDVRGLARRPGDAAWLAEQGAEILPGSLLDRNGLETLAAGCDVLLHTAAWTGGPDLNDEQAWATNVTGTQWLLDAAGNSGVTRFIYFSSVAVYGLTASPVVDETAPTHPVGQLYPDSKIAAEAAVQRAQAQGLATTIVRPASTYGPRGSAWTIGPIQQIKSGRLVLLGRDQGWVNTGYIDNVVDGVVAALGQPAAVGETFNLCDGQVVTYREFYLRYAAMLGLSSLPTAPAWLARGAVSAPGKALRRIAGRPVPGPWSYHFRFNPSRFNIDKARKLLGYEPQIDFDEGMRRTEAWLRSAGYLR